MSIAEGPTPEQKLPVTLSLRRNCAAGPPPLTSECEGRIIAWSIRIGGHVMGKSLRHPIYLGFLVQEEYYEKHCTESFAYGGGSDSCGGLRPAQAGKPDDRYRHHQG